MDPVTIIASLAAFGFSFGSCFVAYAIISRWPTSPQHLANAVADVAAAHERIRAEWAAEKAALDEICETLDTRANRLQTANRRKEKATQAEEPQDPVQEQMKALAGASGVLARVGRH